MTAAYAAICAPRRLQLVQEVPRGVSVTLRPFDHGQQDRYVSRADLAVAAKGQLPQHDHMRRVLWLRTAFWLCAVFQLGPRLPVDAPNEWLSVKVNDLCVNGRVLGHSIYDGLD